MYFYYTLSRSQHQPAVNIPSATTSAVNTSAVNTPAATMEHTLAASLTRPLFSVFAAALQELSPPVSRWGGWAVKLNALLTGASRVGQVRMGLCMECTHQGCDGCWGAHTRGGMGNGWEHVCSNAQSHHTPCTRNTSSRLLYTCTAQRSTQT